MAAFAKVMIKIIFWAILELGNANAKPQFVALPYPSAEDFIAHIIFAEFPNPVFPQGNVLVSPISQHRPAVTVNAPEQNQNLENRFSGTETFTTAEEEMVITTTPPSGNKISLEYKPTRPFYHPNPGILLTQIVPPGQPWPASLDGYANFSATTNRNNPAGQTTPKLPSKEAVNLEDRLGEVSTTTTAQSSGSSPASPSATTNTKIVLDYKPTRPFHHPNPGNLISQIIPPGKPWPASPEGYANFSVTTNRNPPTGETTPKLTHNETVNLEDRLGEVSTTTKPSGSSSEVTTRRETATPSATTSTRIVLEYKPMRPFYHPNPGYSSQIVPSGQPWPASAEGYANFSVTRPPGGAARPTSQDLRNEEVTTNLTENSTLEFTTVLPDTLVSESLTQLPENQANEIQTGRISEQEPQEKYAALEANALHAFHPQHPGRGTTNPPPFTSGTQKSTISDLLDILQHQATISPNRPLPGVSNLLPFEINDDGSRTPIRGSAPSGNRNQQQHYNFGPRQASQGIPRYNSNASARQQVYYNQGRAYRP